MNNDFKMAMCENDENYEVFVKFGDKVTKVSDSEIFFLLSYNDKEEDNVFCNSNVSKETLHKFMCMIDSAIGSLIASIKASPFVESDVEACKNIFEGTLDKKE